MQEYDEFTKFGIGRAKIILVSTQPKSLYIVSCNSCFTKLSMLESDAEANAATALLGDQFKNHFESLNQMSCCDNLEFIFKLPKTKKWVHSNWYKNPNNSFDMICFDVTAQEEELNSFRFQKIGYRNFLENLQGMVFQRILKPVSKTVFIAGDWSEITGYPEEQTSTFLKWLEIVHPDDRQMVLREGELLENQDGYRKELEYRIIRKDGTILWLHSYDSNFISDDGSMQMAQGLIVDVTERKKQEIELERAHKK